MKKKILLLLFLVISCHLAACGESPTTAVEFSVSEEYANMALDICASGDGTIYVAAKNYILKYAPDGQQGEVIELPDRFISRIAFSNGMLYACDELTHEILELDGDGTVLLQIPLSVTHGITKLLATEDFLYLMYENDAFENQLLTVSIADGSETHINIPDLYDFGLYNETQLLVRVNAAFYLYDLETGEMELYYSARQFDGGYAYDPQNKLLFYTDQDTLYVLNEKTQEDSFVRLLDHAYDKTLILTDTLILFDPEDKYICSLDPHTYDAGTNIVYTYNFDKFSIPYANDYTAKTGIEVIDLPGLPVDEKFLAQLLAGDSQYDIFVIYSSDMHSKEYWTNHSYTDLSVSETLVTTVDKMHRSLRDSAYQGEELAGIPLDTSGVVMAFNARSKEYSRAGERIKDWDSFFLFLDELPPGCTILGNKAGMYRMLFDQYLYGYCEPMEGTASFDTEAFRKTLDTMKQISDSPYFQEPGGQLVYVADWSFRSTDVLGINNSGNPSNCASPHRLPDIEETQSLASQITVGYAVVNPNSRHKEEAIRYLEALVTGENFSASSDIFPLPGYENWNLYMENAHVCYETGLYSKVSSIINAWIIGQLTQEEAIASIQEKADLILGE